MNTTIKTVGVSLLILAAGTSCAFFKHPDTMNVSSDIPAAKGEVKFKKTDNGNTAITLTVSYLADPQKLLPPANVYVAWIRATSDSQPQNVGALKVDDKRTGSLETVTPLQGFDLFVTPENSGQVQAPTGKQLFWTTHRP